MDGAREKEKKTFDTLLGEGQFLSGGFWAAAPEGTGGDASPVQ